MRIGITGSSGFIGNELAYYLSKAGHQVLLLQRKTPETIIEGATLQYFDLNKPETFPDTAKLDVLIHTAYAPFTEKNETELNIRATLALSKKCEQTETLFVFLSSLSAHDQALSEYGKHKFELENKLDLTKVLILKLGLVTGKQGLYSRIRKTVAQNKIIPLIGGATQPVQTVSIEVVIKAIANSIEKKITGSYYLASPASMTMKELFRKIAKETGNSPVFVSVPYFFANWVISIIKLLHLPFPVSRENLLGLKQMRAVNTRADLHKLGISIP